MPNFTVNLAGSPYSPLGAGNRPFVIENVSTAQEAAAVAAQALGIPFAILNSPGVVTPGGTPYSRPPGQSRANDPIPATAAFSLGDVMQAQASRNPEAFAQRRLATTPSAPNYYQFLREQEGVFNPQGADRPAVPPFISNPDDPFGPPVTNNPFSGIRPEGAIGPEREVVDEPATTEPRPEPAPADPGNTVPPVPAGSVLGDDAYEALQAILQVIGNASLGAELLDPQFMALLNNPAFMVEQTAFDEFGNPITTRQLHPLVEVMMQAWEVKLTELGRQGDNEAQIAIEQIRQAPFGVIVDEDTAVRLTEEATRAGITSEFGALSLAGASVDEILEGISRGVDQLRGLPPEEREFRLQMARLQNQPQLQQQFLDFIGDPSAVGTAVGLGFNPFGQSQQPAQQAQQPPFIFPDQTADAAEGSEFAAIRNAAGPQTQGPGSIPGFDPGMAFGQMFNDPNITLDFLPQGNFRGAGANPNLNELRDRSSEELQFLTGQAAARGETPSAFERRVRSNTQQGV